MSKSKDQGLLYQVYRTECNGHNFPTAKHYEIKAAEVQKWQNTMGKYLDTIKIYRKALRSYQMPDVHKKGNSNNNNIVGIP